MSKSFFDPFANFEKTVLPNGLTVHSCLVSDKPFQAVGFVVHSGASKDPVGLEGLAHFTEHLVSKNLSYSHDDLKAIFEDQGGAVNLGRTGFLFSSYLFIAPIECDEWSRFLSIFNDILFSSELKSSVESEIGAIMGEFYYYYPEGDDIDFELRGRGAIFNGLWPERFLEKPIGIPQSIKKITINDAQSFYSKYYVPSNVSIISIGGMKHQELVELILRSPLGESSKVGEEMRIPDLIKEINVPSETRLIHCASDDGLEIPDDASRYKSIACIPGIFSQSAVDIFIKSLNTTLFKEVRSQRGWTYDISSEFEDYGGFYNLQITCDSLALEAVDHIEKVVNDCIRSISTDRDLFERKKNQSLARSLMFDANILGTCEVAMMDLVYYQRIRSLMEYKSEIERVTMSDMKKIAKILHSKNRWTLVVRP